MFVVVFLEYFTSALGPALTEEAATGWTNLLDLMIEVVRDTAKRGLRINLKVSFIIQETLSEDEFYRKAGLSKNDYGMSRSDKVCIEKSFSIF